MIEDFGAEFSYFDPKIVEELLKHLEEKEHED